MKTLHHYPPAFIMLLAPCLLAAQESLATIEKEAYYEQRAREDAEYEQQLALKDEEARDFWEDQGQYEAQLKKRDRQAYRAYMRGKRDAYAEHYSHCGHHCGHGHTYFHHASGYYSGYHYHRTSPAIRTGIQAGVPGIRLGVF